MRHPAPYQRTYNRCIEKAGNDEAIRYVYDGGNVIAEYDGNGGLLCKYIYGPRVDEPVCMINVADSNAVSYYHFDGLGSVVALSDSDGDSVQSYEYSIYGQVAAEDPNHTNPYMFTGRRFDFETGLYYYRARYYNPYIGRFLQTDPVGYGDGMNWYAYCGNNPLGCVDPSGTKVIDYALSSAWDPKAGKARISFTIYHDEILDSGLSRESWFFDTFDGWFTWAKNNKEGRFTYEWIKQQAGYQLAGNGGFFEEDEFWYIQACIYTGAFTSSEIEELGEDGVMIEINSDMQNSFYSPHATPGDPWKYETPNTIYWDSCSASLTGANYPDLSIFAHELGHAYGAHHVGGYYDLWDYEIREYYAIQRQNAVGWWFYINETSFKGIVHPELDFTTVGAHDSAYDAWNEYISKGGFDWAN